MANFVVYLFYIISLIRPLVFKGNVEGSVLRPIINILLPVPAQNYIYLNVYKDYRSYDRIPLANRTEVIKTYPQFNASQKTVFYFPGWSENPNDNIDSTNTISDAFIQRGGINIIIIDYSVLVQNKQNRTYLSYADSVLNVSAIGEALGNYLKAFNKSVQNDKMFRLVGHSMGGQIMSKTAKVYGAGILRLTGLDPAYPLYEPPLPHLKASDGSFVDIIHTDAGKYGYLENVGHVDFYPNNGTRVQPYCLRNDINDTDGFCSHHMSWRYFSASVVNETLFPAKRCHTTKLIMINTLCKNQEFDNVIAYMGYGVSKSANGSFYLKTSAYYPFGLGNKRY